MSKKDKREICRVVYRNGDDFEPQCALIAGHGDIHVSPGSTGMTVWSAAAPVAQDEQHEGDDGKRDEDRPQHDDGDTRDFLPVHGWVCDQGGGVFQVVVDSDTYEYPTGNVTTIPSSQWGPLLASQITPEIQAVLDAVPGWLDWENRQAGSPVMDPRQAAMYHAANSYLATITRKSTAIEALQAMLDHRRSAALAAPNTGDILSALHDAGFEIVPMR